MPDIKPTSIRLDAELLRKIQEEAETEKRSISKQIEYMLVKYYEMRNLIKG